jgi:hypothetical protein
VIPTRYLKKSKASQQSDTDDEPSPRLAELDVSHAKEPYASTISPNLGRSETSAFRDASLAP